MSGASTKGVHPTTGFRASARVRWPWVMASTTSDDRQRVLGPTADRVHVTEYAWLQRIQAAQVFAYRFDASTFEPYGDAAHPHAFVSRHPVRPPGPPEPVGDLLTLHERARIKLRLVDSLLRGGRS
jgi:hypothetical protein